jgi:hypothetical protein
MGKAVALRMKCQHHVVSLVSRGSNHQRSDNLVRQHVECSRIPLQSRGHIERSAGRIRDPPSPSPCLLVPMVRIRRLVKPPENVSTPWRWRWPSWRYLSLLSARSIIVCSVLESWSIREMRPLHSIHGLSAVAVLSPKLMAFWLRI